MTSTPPGRSRPILVLLGSSAVAGAAVLIWYLWLGADTTYQFDPVTQTSSGPYQAWQVVGCALSLLVLLVGALLLGLRPVPASAALTVAFTTAWTVQAAGHDETGMYGVGATMLLIGLAASTAAVSAVTVLARSARRRPSQPA